MCLIYLEIQSILIIYAFSYQIINSLFSGFSPHQRITPSYMYCLKKSKRHYRYYLTLQKASVRFRKGYIRSKSVHRPPKQQSNQVAVVVTVNVTIEHSIITLVQMYNYCIKEAVYSINIQLQTKNKIRRSGIMGEPFHVCSFLKNTQHYFNLFLNLLIYLYIMISNLSYKSYLP